MRWLSVIYVSVQHQVLWNVMNVFWIVVPGSNQET